VVKSLIETYPDRKFYYLIGSDQAKQIRRWRNSRKLLRTINFIVSKRKGFFHVPWSNSSGDHITVERFKEDRPGAASSRIRVNFATDRESLLHNRHASLLSAVHDYIIENNLYTK